MSHDEEKPKRVVRAPWSDSSGTSGQVLDVTLAEDEDVIWEWTHSAEGTSVVTGYRIVPREAADEARGA